MPLVVLFPFLEALGMSFYEFTIEMSEPEWNGIANFVAVLSDRSVISSFVTTMIFVGCATFFSILLGLGWALILNHPFPGRTVLRGLSLMPWVMPAIVAAFIWGWIFNSRYGLINALAMELGLIEHPMAYLSTPAGAMAAVVIAKVWLSVPLFMAFFIAGLQSMDREQMEAARVDGAGNWQILTHHVLPHLPQRRLRHRPSLEVRVRPR